MLIVVLLLCLGTSGFVAARRRDALSLYFLGMSISNLVMLAGVIVYIAKMGGLAATQKQFLFLISGLQHWLQFLPVSMDRLGYIVAVGRTVFPLLTILAAMETTMITFLRRNKQLLEIILIGVSMVFLVYYFPPVFRALTNGRLNLVMIMIRMSMTVNMLYLFIATVLLLIEYFSTTIPFYRKNFGYVILSVVGMEALYSLYAIKDPAQIYNMFIVEYIRMGISTYIGPGLSARSWAFLMMLTVCFVVLGSYGMLRYTVTDYDQNRQDMILQRKFDTAGSGISVFVHGIKNQLLSSKVLNKRLERALSADPPDMEMIRSTVGQLNVLTDGMLSRMDELYQSVRSKTLTLRPVSVSAVADSAIKRFQGKYPEKEITVGGTADRMVLADISLLSEAVYNLLINGYEAAEQAGRVPAVELIFHDERLWTVMEVKDNGGGISKELQDKIFDPFYTSKNTNRNWGMGLYLVKKIVKSHFGTLRLESRDGEGSSFFIMLPIYDSGR
jgi:signal transduction histidine kinase